LLFSDPHPHHTTFNFVILILPFIALNSCSSVGPTVLQGPHNSAQKSTRTGLSDDRTSLPHVVLVVLNLIYDWS
jgi:hypothetical protein